MYLIRYVGTQLKTAQHALSYLPLFWRAADLGLRACLVCARPPVDERWLDPLADVGTKIVYLPRPKRNFDAGCALRSYRLCRELNARVFHCDNMHTSPLIGAALAGVPVRIWSKRSMQPCFEQGRRPTLRDRLAVSVRVSCGLSTRVLAVSSAVRDELASMGMNPAKLRVQRNAVNFADTRATERGAARRALGLADDDLVFTAVGRSVHVKGWDLLLEAFAPVARAHPKARLLLVGDTTGEVEREHFEDLELQMAALGIMTRVRLPGYLTDLSDVWGATDVFVMPSRSEGDSNALLQALATTQACIATQVGSAGDLIRNEENGLLVPREDAAALGAAMLRLAGDAALCERLRRANIGRKHAPTIEEYADQVIEVYQQLLGPRRLDRIAPA